MYPEGTRSDDGYPKRFKRAGLSLLIEGGRAIVPVTIIGTFDFLPKGAIRYRTGGLFKMVIGKPLDAKDFPDAETMIASLEETVQKTFSDGSEEEIKGASEAA